MNPNSELLVIQADEASATELERVAKQHDHIRFQSLKIQAQVGDPDTWMFVAELTKSALPYLSAAILLLIRQRKIRHIKIGNDEFHNITPEQFEHVMRIREGGKHDG
jgi:hypothetical protein